MALQHFKGRRAFATVGYKGFGSFHSENVEDLIRNPLRVLEIATPRDVLQVDEEQRLIAARAIKDMSPVAMARLFHIDVEAWTFLNHGAFGGALVWSSQVAAAWRLHSEKQPLFFFDRELLPGMVKSLHALATTPGYLGPFGISPLHVLPLQNVTSGLNAVIRHLSNAEKPILTLDVGYGSMKKIVKHYSKHHVEVSLLPHLSSLTDDLILELVTEALDQHDVEAAIFDHVTSNTALVLPIQQLVRACKCKGVKVLIDGAHGLMTQPLDLPNLGADFYVGNLHKWFCAPKGAGFLYVKDYEAASSSSKPLSPCIVSHGVNDGLLSSFLFDGCRDYAAFLSIPACIAFWELYGGPGAFMQYSHGLIREASKLLQSKWSTDTLSPKGSIHHGSMALVRLPDEAHLFSSDKTSTQTQHWGSSHAKAVQDTLHYHFNIEVPIKAVNGALYVRISAHLYNTLEDYEHFGQTLVSDDFRSKLQQGFMA